MIVKLDASPESRNSGDVVAELGQKRAMRQIVSLEKDGEFYRPAKIQNVSGKMQDGANSKTDKDAKGESEAKGSIGIQKQ